MPKLARFFATTLLVLSMSFVTLAEGGNTQGPGITSEPPPPAEGCVAPCDLAVYSPEQGNSVDIPTEFAVLVALLTQSIF
jgi:hypothetical protein